MTKAGRLDVFFLTALVLLWLGNPIHLHSQTSNATILGTVTDSSGGAIANAAVQVTNSGTGASRTVTADVQGRYNVPDLQIGSYEVQASAAGFQKVVRT